MNAGHCGASVSKLRNGLEMLLSLSKFKIDVASIIPCQHNITGKQIVAIAVFSQRHRFFCSASDKSWAGGLGTRLTVSYVRYIVCTNNLWSSIGV